MKLKEVHHIHTWNLMKLLLPFLLLAYSVASCKQGPRDIPINYKLVGMLTAVPREKNSSKDQVLALMTNHNIYQLVDEAGKLIPYQENIRITKQTLYLDSIYYMEGYKMGETTFLCREAKQLYKGTPIVDLEGTFSEETIEGYPARVLNPLITFISNNKTYYICLYEGCISEGGSYLGGTFYPSYAYNPRTKQDDLITAKFIQLNENKLILYKYISKRPKPSDKPTSTKSIFGLLGNETGHLQLTK